MKKINGNGSVYIGADQMKPSRKDAIALVQAVGERYNNLLGSYRNLNGVPLLIPKSLDNDVKVLQRVTFRYMKGDFRHTRAEELSVRAVADWTLVENAKMRNQTLSKVEWRD